jgi:hypothetical protein
MAFSPRFWAAILIVAAMLGVVGPFGTFSQIPFLLRIGYWFAVALTTYTVGYAFIGLVLGYYLPGPKYRGAKIVLAGFVAALPITGVVLLLDRALFNEPRWVDRDLIALVINVALISAGITFLYDLISGSGRATTSTQPATLEATQGTAAPTTFPADIAPPVAPPARPPLVERLTPAARGALAYMSMQDHYVDVHTDRGSALVLLRLADAMRETGAVAGLQIHRSHWVAMDAVQGTLRKDGKLYVKMQDGALLPVSRSFQAAVRAAGVI